MKPCAQSWSRALLLLLLLLGGPGRGLGAEVTAYGAIFQAALDGSGTEWILIRSFLRDGMPHYLAIDPRTLGSRILPAEDVKASGPPGASLASTPYLRTLASSMNPPYPLQNDGVARAESSVAGQFLTVDLCPSARPLKRELFASHSIHGAGGTPLPVALAVSGLWLRSHLEEFRWLRSEEAAGRLTLTWVNHSLSHPYDPTLPLEGNFLLTPGTDLDREVLETERLLLQEGAIPSPFFRFPGLVSDRRTMTRLVELGLIPLGSDAWLAKGGIPVAGSFILVHGNGNEPGGVRRFLELQRDGKLLPLLPLAEAFQP